MKDTRPGLLRHSMLAVRASNAGRSGDDERDGEGGGDADLRCGLRRDGVDVEVDEEGENVMCTLEEPDIALERLCAEHWSLEDG